MLDINEYQQQVTKVKKYPKGIESSLYLLAKLTEETGEVAKEMRKRIEAKIVQKDLKSELGDILWCITAIAEENNITLQSIFESNIEKLRQRNLL